MDKLTSADRKDFERTIPTLVTVDLEAILYWISDTLTPEQVFEPADLVDWAQRNGWTQGD